MQCCVRFCCRTESVMCVYILFRILFQDGLSQDIEYNSLCYMVGPCYLFILWVKFASANPKRPVHRSLPRPPWQPQVYILLVPESVCDSFLTAHRWRCRKGGVDPGRPAIPSAEELFRGPQGKAVLPEDPKHYELQLRDLQVHSGGSGRAEKPEWHRDPQSDR